MAGYKLLKRKGIDHVADDFYDFPLSSPATKIRRLDCELPPIAEVELEHEQSLPIPAEAEADAPPPPNEERALVLFKPLMHSSSPFSLTLHSDLLSQLKNEGHWSKQGDSDCERLIRSTVEKEEQDKRNRGMAIVPWAPSSILPQDSNTANTELMEADQMAPEPEEGSVMMDVENPQEEESSSMVNSSTAMLNLSNGGGVLVGGAAATPEGFNQWQQQQQQQHCLWPHLPQNMSTPITWTR
ncbi:hypothetical protein PIB30_024932 [Stylosanthes scabra]|uniref:Uncharacterized protein n=1 Tax=Stylosanthes scabra TaxID=79078 RepID=A0ABU6UA82_9FABA|nr:hypothetical protein [Stylosanthes scabra]